MNEEEVNELLTDEEKITFIYAYMRGTLKGLYEGSKDGVSKKEQERLWLKLAKETQRLYEMLIEKNGLSLDLANQMFPVLTESEKELEEMVSVYG